MNKDSVHKKNEEIRDLKVLVIDENGEKLGVIDTNIALQDAQQKGLDLVIVSPQANPPVAKIISWSKFKYDQEKKKKETKNKSSDMKEMRFKPFIEEQDLNHKLKKIKEFVSKKCSVKIAIRARGRIHKEHFTNLMSTILEKTQEYAEFQSEPKFNGYSFEVIIIPRKTKLIKTSENDEKQNQDTQSQSKTI